MIIVVRHNYKDLSNWDKYIDSLNESTLPSPNDGSVSFAERHSCYFRDVISSPQEVFKPVRIKIPVFKFPTKDGPRYHALLPEDVCPFLAYSYPFLVQILTFYFGQGNQSTKGTAMHFSVSRSTIRTILRLFEARRFEITRLSRALQFRMDPIAYVKQLKEDRLLLSSFLLEFIKTNIRPFLVTKLSYSHFMTSRPYLYAPHGGHPINRTLPPSVPTA